MGVRKRSSNGKEGLIIKEVEKINDHNVLVKIKGLKFDEDDIAKYKKHFEELKKEGILLENCNYEDRTWKGLGLHHHKTFDFGDYEYNNKIYQSLKAYVVTRLYHNRESITGVSRSLGNLKNVLKETKIFDIRELNHFSDYMEARPDSTKATLVTDILSYLLFNPVEYKEEFSEVVLNSDMDNSKIPRKIPPIMSVIAFSEELEKFFINANNEEKIKYYPVYLWWKITSIIPLRPNEFIQIKKNCIKTENNKHFLTLPRSKQEPNPLSKKIVVPTCDKIEINDELNDLISEYISISKIDNEEYLIPLSIYTRFKEKAGTSHGLSIFKDRIGYLHMRDLLNDFQDNIIGLNYKIIDREEYYRELENIESNEEEIPNVQEKLKATTDILSANKFVRINLGDTRHFAFCSLMLQGFNPLTIASIGGHKKLDSQMNYHKHLDVYVDCYTYLLKNSIKHNIDKQNAHQYGKTSREISLMKFDKREAVREVEGGFCCSKNFPKECVSIRCTRCSKYKVDFDNFTEYTKIALKETIDEIEQEMKTKISFVKRYHTSSLEDLKSDKNDKELKKDADSLRKNAQEKARLEAILDVIERC